MGDKFLLPWAEMYNWRHDGEPQQGPIAEYSKETS